MFLAFSIIASVILALLLHAARGAKLAIRHRVIHIRYVVITIAFSITAVACFSKLLQLINRLLTLQVVQRILFFLIPPSNVSAGFYWIITLICCIILMLLYCALIYLLKAIWIYPLSNTNYLESRFWPERFWNWLAGLFYEIVENRAKLPPKMANFGQWVRISRIVFGIILIAESLFIGIGLQFNLPFLTETFFTQFVKSVYMIPVISYIILQQVELFFVADQKKEERLLDTEEVEIGLQGNFDKLVDLYETAFGGSALITHYTGSGKKGVQQELFSGVQQEQLERTDNPELLEALCRSVQCATTPTSHYINGLVDLINGMDIAVFDSLWSDFDAYYLSYMQHCLHIGKTALILCDTRHQVSLMKERVSFVFKKINIADPIWRVCDIDSMTDNGADVLVCTEEQLLEETLDSRFPDFYDRLSMVVVLETYDLLCREDACFSRLFDTLSKESVQFVFYLLENNTDIRDELQSRMAGRKISLCESSNVNDATKILLWRSESAYKPQKVISERLYHDFGVAYTIAIIAARHEVPGINILAPETIPTTTYYSLVTKEYAKVLLEDYIKSSAINLSSVIQNNGCLLSDESSLMFNIIYDEHNNLLNVAKTWLSYNTSVGSMLNIVSSPYMLRDYFAANMDSLCVGSTGLQLIVPRSALDVRAPAIALLLRMRKGITCEEVLQFAKTYSLEEVWIDGILKHLLTAIFGKGHRYDIYTSFSFAECEIPKFADNQFIYTQTITLVNENLYNTLCELTTNFVKLQGDYFEVLPIHQKDIYNHFLPKQCVSYGSVRYVIDDIVNENVILRTEETVDMEEQYTPLYEITEFTKIKDYGGYTISTEKLSVSFFETKITRVIKDYYAHTGLLKFKDEKEANLVELKNPIIETKNAPCLCLELCCPFEGYSDKVANTLCHLLKGAMQTFIPHNYKDILIFSAIDKEAVKKGVSFKEISDLLDDPIPSDLTTGFENYESINPDILRLIPSISGESLQKNTSEKIYLYMVHFSETDTGLLKAIATDLDRILSTLYQYLTWVEAQAGVQADYMRFGYQHTPGIFDPVATLVSLAKLVPQVLEKAKDTEELQLKIKEGSEHCSFCGKPVPVVSYPMKDGRIMCAECHNHITTQRKEIQILLGEAKDMLEKHYGITLPADIRVKFKSASAIRKECSTSGFGRVLGFYNLKRREIWVERGGPEPCVLSTLVHELTHAWQHANLDMNRYELKYIEGHSSYVEVECLRLKKQNVYADFCESQLMASDDVYGQGYRFWKDYLRIETNKNIFQNIKELF